MGLKRKIRTLLDPEKRLANSYEQRRRKCNDERPYPLTAEGLLRDLDREKLNAILSDDSNSEAGIHTVKYLEVEKWLAVNIRRVVNIGLDFASPKRVLDLGSGAGYFLYTCKRLGHDVLGLDLHDPTAGWYGKIFDLFGVRRAIWRITAFVPLPDLGPRFDYVCGFMICFNDHQSDNPWKIEEWRFFLDDLATRMNPGAIIWLELNPALDGSHYTPELQSFFESRGAIVDGKRLIWGLDPIHYRVLLRQAQLEAVAMRKAAANGGEMAVGAEKE